MCANKGLAVDTLKAEWGSVYTPEQMDAALSAKKYAAVTVTHVDTSTGVVVPLKAICDMMKKKHPDVMLIVDAVAAAAGAEAWMDWGIDVLLTCSQKAFGVAPGLAILWASRRAVEKRRSRASEAHLTKIFQKLASVSASPLFPGNNILIKQ